MHRLVSSLVLSASLFASTAMAKTTLLNAPEIKTGAGTFSNAPTSESVFTVFRLADQSLKVTRN